MKKDTKSFPYDLTLYFWNDILNTSKGYWEREGYMGTVIGYARVSSGGQSLDVQMDQLKSAGCTKIFSEKVSGAKQDRPELAAMMEYIRKGEGDVVICCKLDRIARSSMHLLRVVEQLKEKGAEFKVLNNPIDTTSPHGKLQLQILAAFAEFELNIQKERRKEGIDAAKAKGGVYVGRQPTAKNQTAEVLRLLAEGMTKQEVAAKLKIGKSSVYRIAADAKHEMG
jgi:DNA invertase Pin-like site-specific DNA recombinase